MCKSVVDLLHHLLTSVRSNGAVRSHDSSSVRYHVANDRESDKYLSHRHVIRTEAYTGDLGAVVSALQQKVPPTHIYAQCIHDDFSETSQIPGGLYLYL